MLQKEEVYCFYYSIPFCDSCIIFSGGDEHLREHFRNEIYQVSFFAMEQRTISCTPHYLCSKWDIPDYLYQCYYAYISKYTWSQKDYYHEKVIINYEIFSYVLSAKFPIREDLHDKVWSWHRHWFKMYSHKCWTCIFFNQHVSKKCSIYIPKMLNI